MWDFSKIFVLCAFILTYVFIIAFAKYKHLVAIISAIVISSVCLLFGKMFFTDVLNSVDYNVVLMLCGIMITVGLFSDSEMPNKLADKLMSKIPNALLSVTILCVLSGVISAFIDNVATVLMLAPIGLAVAQKTKISPIPIIICIAVSSNLQGASTLVGDTTSIMLGGFADMSFFEFFFLDGKPSIFWAVEIGAFLTIPVILFVFRKSNAKCEYISENIQVKSVVPTILLALNILALIIVSFFNIKFDLTNGVICVFFAIIGLIFYISKFKKQTLVALKNSFDYQTVLFLLFLFIIIGAVESVGIIDDLSSIFVSIGNKNIFLLYTIIVFGSVLFSAFIDNIPYVATMLPVIKGLTVGLTGVSPYLLYFGLLIGATLGGNITPVGASANVVGIGILNKNGFNVKNADFFKIGVPFTLVAVLGGYLFCWFVWGM